MKQMVRMRRIETWKFNSTTPRDVAADEIKSHFSEQKNILNYSVVKIWNDGQNLFFRVAVDFS